MSTENNELYGSVKPTEISKLIHEVEKIEIKPSMIQPIKEIKSLSYVEEINYQGNLIKKIEGAYKRLVEYVPYFLGIIIFIITKLMQ